MKKNKIIKDYDKENDIFFANWGGKVEYSLELEGGIILDIDKNDNVVGIQIFDLVR